MKLYLFIYKVHDYNENHVIIIIIVVVLLLLIIIIIIIIIIIFIIIIIIIINIIIISSSSSCCCNSTSSNNSCMYVRTYVCMFVYLYFELSKCSSQSALTPFPDLYTFFQG